VNARVVGAFEIPEHWQGGIVAAEVLASTPSDHGKLLWTRVLLDDGTNIHLLWCTAGYRAVRIAPPAWGIEEYYSGAPLTGDNVGVAWADIVRALTAIRDDVFAELGLDRKAAGS
jgi:hypothetical protein